MNGGKGRERKRETRLGGVGWRKWKRQVGGTKRGRAEKAVRRK